ncbi:MAG: Na+/H+ antiporter NhaC family protein [Bacteroidota bacterium]
MTEHYGYLSIIPPVLAIILAIRTKQVFVSLTFGIFIGWLIIDQFLPHKAIFSTINSFVQVFEDAGNTRTVIFTLLVGSLITLVQVSGGVSGFIKRITSLIQSIEERKNIKGTRLVQLFAAFSGLLIFVESNISILTVGTIFRPLFTKLKLSSEKLAYLIDSSSAPSCILIPFNAWGAYVMGLLIQNGLDNPFEILFSSIIFNFYPILAITFLFIIVLTGKEFGPMKRAQEKALNSHREETDPSHDAISMDSEGKTSNIELQEGRTINMLLPIAVLIIMMPMMLYYTGMKDQYEATDTMGKFFEAIGNGSGSASVLYSVIFSIVAAIVLYALQGAVSFTKSIEHILSGMSEMVSLALLMVLAFALGSLCKQLGTGFYVAEVTSNWLSPGLVPFILFLTSCFIAFSTGTSWGTFAIMIAIAVPLTQQMDAHLYMSIAAVLGGGVFGDHCSPISDTTIISSIASGSDHVEHVRTQLPYALIPGALAALFYLVIGTLL